jgi:hypothetical protein
MAGKAVPVTTVFTVRDKELKDRVYRSDRGSLTAFIVRAGVFVALLKTLRENQAAFLYVVTIAAVTIS